MSFTTLLGITGIAALISAATTLIALLLKEHVFARSFERWKTARELELAYRKYRDPLFVACVELANRCHELTGRHGALFLDSSLLPQCDIAQIENSVNDIYFRRYKLLSSIYRLCALLGWLELYRQQVVFLDEEAVKLTKRFHACVDLIRSDLADGQLNNAANWESWKDVLVFREEQRAIGEAMIDGEPPNQRVIGYGTFCDNFMADTSRGRWLRTAGSFLYDPEPVRSDFRQVRLRRMTIHATDIARCLYSSRVSDWLSQSSDRLAEMMSTEGYPVNRAFGANSLSN